MKKLTKVAVLAIGMAMAAHGAYAGSAGDIILGINNNDTAGSPGNDFTFDLGSLSSLVANTPIDLGITAATLESNSGIGAGPSGYNIGLSGGQKLSGNSGAYVNFSTLDNGTGTASVAGSSAPANPTEGNLVSAGGAAKTLSQNAVNGVVLSTFTYSFTTDVAKDTSTPANIASLLGSNPLQLVSGNTVTLDLWRDTAGASSPGGWVYEGDILVNFAPATGDITATYDPSSAVPEPTTYGMLAGGGLLALALRRQFGRKTA